MINSRSHLRPPKVRQIAIPGKNVRFTLTDPPACCYGSTTAPLRGRWGGLLVSSAKWGFRLLSRFKTLFAYPAAVLRPLFHWESTPATFPTQDFRPETQETTRCFKNHSGSRSSVPQKQRMQMRRVSTS